GQQILIIEGHTYFVESISFSSDSQLLASKTPRGTVCIWSAETGEMLTTFEEKAEHSWPIGIAFHPNAPTLATLDTGGNSIRIWDLDVVALLEMASVKPSAYYTNAKVVLVGDSGVGKTGLS